MFAESSAGTTFDYVVVAERTMPFSDRRHSARCSREAAPSPFVLQSVFFFSARSWLIKLSLTPRFDE